MESFNLFDEPKPIFPVIEYSECSSITPETLGKIINGELEYDVEGYTIIDCRYNYEYRGGHIQGAINISDPKDMEFFLENNIQNGKSMAIILHCEYSSIRAPKMFRHIRDLDRFKHLRTYPELDYPHLFVLDGGYKAFFSQYADLCEPKEYVKMSDSRFDEEYNDAKGKVKSRKARGKRQLIFLNFQP